jgi:hypothetical protein
MLSIGIGTFAIGTRNGGYEEVQDLASVKCLGCLGLNSVVPGFDGFWTVYPEGHEKEGEEVEHPELVTRTFDRDDVDLLILFYWTQGCVPCAEQWEEMKKEGIVSGEEDGGREGDKYPKTLIYSLDAGNFDEYTVDHFGSEITFVPNEMFWTYHINGDPYYNGVPDTVFIFERDGEIYWYMHYGSKMELSEVDGMINKILYHEIAHAD